MDRKGELNVGVLLTVFAGVIVALALYQSTVGYYGTTSTTYAYNTSSGSASLVVPAASACTDLTGQELINTPQVINHSEQAAVPATNYTIAEAVSTVDGLKRIRYCSAGQTTFAGETVNISYVYGPEGYIAESSSRSITALIAIFAALAIGIFVLVPVLKEKFDF